MSAARTGGGLEFLLSGEEREVRCAPFAQANDGRFYGIM